MGLENYVGSFGVTGVKRSFSHFANWPNLASISLVTSQKLLAAAEKIIKIPPIAKHVGKKLRFSSNHSARMKA